MALGDLLLNKVLPFGKEIADQIQPIGQHLQQQIKNSISSVEKTLHTPLISTNSQTLDSNVQNVALPVLVTIKVALLLTLAF